MPRHLLTIIVLLGLIPAAIYAGMTMAFRSGMIDLSTLFGTLLSYNEETGDRGLGWLILGLLGGAGLQFLLGVISLFSKRGGLVSVAFLAGLVSLVMALGPIQMFKTASSEGVPAIHDITTDTENPPVFVATASERTEGMNPPEYDREQTAAQLEAYPDILPIEVRAEPSKAYKAALRVAKNMGLAIASADSERRLIEGTATTRWFGFKDDVIIRVTPAESSGAVIDIRSKSRIGRSDIRANADRIREMRRQILKELDEQQS